MICFHPEGSPRNRRLLIKNARIKEARLSRTIFGVKRDFMFNLLMFYDLSA
jgi:hypothetical protein